MLDRLVTMCELWPAISPHGPEVPTSVWNLQYGVWLGFASATDRYVAEMKKQQQQQKRR